MSVQADTENTILASAEKLFYQKGKAGCSMQDIADDAGINRTLLNYYYRTKDQLFEAVFKGALGRVVPQLASLLRSDIPVQEFIPKVIETIIDAMIENPQIPGFVIQELNSNPERMPQLITDMGIDPEVATAKLEADETGAFVGSDARQVIMSILSLCIFPFAARPVVQEILYGGDDQAFIEAMKALKELIPLMVGQIIKQQDPKP